jgi:hypothetical protein
MPLSNNTLPQETLLAPMEGDPRTLSPTEVVMVTNAIADVSKSQGLVAVQHSDDELLVLCCSANIGVSASACFRCIVYD